MMFYRMIPTNSSKSQFYDHFIEKKKWQQRVQKNDKGFFLKISLSFSIIYVTKTSAVSSAENTYFSQSYFIRSNHKCYNKLFVIPC